MNSQRGAAPTVSVLLPAYNTGRYLRETLESVVKQTYRDWELVVIDDGSTDDTAEILRGCDDPRLRVFHNPENLGLIRSLNRGLTLCCGGLIARIDGDDLCEPERLAVQVRYLQENPGIAGCGTWTTEVDESGRPTGRHQPCGDPDYVRWALCHTVPLYHPSMMLRREAFDAAGDYDVSADAVEDYDLWTRMITAGMRLAVIERKLIRYRRREGSITSSKQREQREGGHRIRLRYVGKLLGAAAEPAAVERMCRLLSWDEMSPSEPDRHGLPATLRLMRRLRKASLARAAPATIAAADHEMVKHLSRWAGLLLGCEPGMSLRLAGYVTELPTYRQEGLGLCIRALRCLGGRWRNSLGRKPID